VRFAAGASESEVVAMLHDEGVFIVEAMWILLHSAGLSLRDAKNLVACHPAWQREAEAGEALHDELEKWADEENQRNAVKSVAEKPA
jgi:hypothetical protein